MQLIQNYKHGLIYNPDHKPSLLILAKNYWSIAKY